jgi:zinc protease
MPYDGKTEMHIDALGELLSIKLIEKLREDESGVYGVGASGSMQQIPYGNLSFRIAFPCGPENVESLIKFTLEQIDDIKSGKVLEEDVNKIKESYLVNYREDLKKDSFWLSYLANTFKHKKKWSRILNYEEKVANITIDDLVRTANTFLDDKYFLGILNPEE